MFTLFLRAVLLYGLLIAAMRLLGKRQLGELQPYELALTILLAEIVAGPIDSVAIPLLHGLLPMAAVMIVHGVLSIACVRSDRLRALISGKPAVVISRGVINRAELDRLCLNLADLLEGLRCAGFLDPSEVGTAVVEANGNISAFAGSDSRPANTRELQLQPGYEGIPMILIMDGRLQKHNLQSAHLSEPWLKTLLSDHSLTIPDIFLCVVDTQGFMTVQDRAGNLSRFRAIDGGEVKW